MRRDAPLIFRPIRARRPNRAILVAILALLPSVCFALDAAGEKAVAEIRSALRPVAANLQLAEQSAGAGSGPVGRSAAGLTRARLEGAVKGLPAVQKRLAALPAEDPAVAPLAAEVAEVAARIEALQARLDGKPAPAPAPGAVPPAAGPGPDPVGLQADIDRAGGLGDSYGNATILLSDPEVGARLLEQLPQAKAELARLQSRHSALLEGRTLEADRMRRALDYLSRNLAGFERFLETRRAPFAAQLDKDFAALVKLTDEAVANRRPAFFSGGIAQRVAEMKPKLELLRVVDPAQGARLSEALAGFEAGLPEKQAALRDVIIASNAPAADLFRGPDRAAIIDAATRVWTKRQPGAKILTARIPAMDWKREVLWRWSGTQWYKIDRSKIQMQLIVSHDDSLAIIRWHTVWKDHLEGDRITATPLWEPGEGLQPTYFLPLAKVP